MGTSGKGVLPAQQVRILGNSFSTSKLRDEIARVAPFSSSVLITGPSGTGKELVARRIHARSSRSDGRLIPVDCASVSGELMTSQLFGHRAGAFTGANYDALGCFRAADKGTIFLDEIGEMVFSLQAKLLRVLQEGVVVPVGSQDQIPIDVRVVAATNRDLEKDVAEGRFREDLFFRLNVMRIETLALAQRPEDLLPLATGFLDDLASEGLPRKSLSPGAIEALEHFSWPGNVRQLRNVMEQAVITCETELITLEDIQHLLVRQRGHFEPDNTVNPAFSHNSSHPQQPASENLCQDSSSWIEEEHWPSLAKLERDHILCTLEHTYYNRSATARLLGVTRQALLRKMKKFGIRVPVLRGKPEN